MERSTSSKWPSRSSSGLPPRNSSLPARARATRHSMSPYSSAGTAKNTTRPLSASSALASSSPIAAPISAATCALWPQAWAAPVAGSPSGWPATTSPSSSPSSANVGPSPARPGASARTPVRARPDFGLSPSPAKVASTSRAVLTSLEPSSGCLRIRSPSPTISSARRSMAAYTRSFSSFFVMEAPFRRYSTRHGLPPRRRGGRRHRAGPGLLLLYMALVRRGGVSAPGALSTRGHRRGVRPARHPHDEVPHRGARLALHRPPPASSLAGHPRGELAGRSDRGRDHRRLPALARRQRRRRGRPRHRGDGGGGSRGARVGAARGRHRLPPLARARHRGLRRSEEHTSELQ